jgi:cell division protein FtsL
MTEGTNYDQKTYYEAAAGLRERQTQSKEEMRKRLKSLSFTEKIRYWRGFVTEAFCLLGAA